MGSPMIMPFWLLQGRIDNGGPPRPSASSQDMGERAPDPVDRARTAAPPLPAVDAPAARRRGAP